VRLLTPARLVVIDGAPPFADSRLPARLRDAACDLRAAIIVLATSREPAWAGRRELIASGQVDDVILVDTEREEVLVAAWTLHGGRCRRKVEALRLAHESTPVALHHLLEELLLTDSAELSVSAWAASKPDNSRFSLRRQLAREGLNPKVLVDVARMLNAVARAIVHSRSRAPGHVAALPEAGSARRLLWRTMGMTPGGVTELAEKDGPEAVHDRARQAVGAMLRVRDHRRSAAP
jgi:hypothetical protein